jgi:hypothetical protein
VYGIYQEDMAMAIELIEEAGSRLVTVELSGKLVKSDYEVFVPEMERLIRQFGKLDILLVMNDFHGWEATALWEDIKFDVKHFGDIRRLAMVGETKWEKWMASFCKPFTTAQIKFFEKDQLTLARLWVQLRDEQSSPAMPHHTPAAFGIYTQRTAVENAVGHLKEGGFTAEEISVLLPPKFVPPSVDETKEETGLKVGAGAGAVVGGVLGWLAGVGLIAIPGAAAALVGGPIVSAFVASATLASLGGIWGGIVGLGIPEKEGRHYEGRLHKGDILLSVHCEEPARLMKAKTILADTGAEDIYSRQ